MSNKTMFKYGDRVSDNSGRVGTIVMANNVTTNPPHLQTCLVNFDNQDKYETVLARDLVREEK